MENKLTNEEISRVFAMYYFADCITTEFPEKGKVNHIGKIPTDADYCKLLLTPLSAITDEHAIEVMKLGNSWKHDCEIFKISRERFSDNSMHIHFKQRRKYTYDETAFNEDGYFYHSCFFQSKAHGFSYYQIQYLIQQGYAIPLFFGINHWANGKTAIDLGIGIQLTK